MEIVLASTSPYRKKLMEDVGFAFQYAAPLCDEEALKARPLPPRQLAQKLARAKAESLRSKFPNAAIIGSDQVIALGTKIFSKPGTADRAEAQLREMSGRTHEVLTAVCVLTPNATHEHIDLARMTLRPLTTTEIVEYIAADQPLNCAGSYKLESRGAALFEKIDCADRTAIVGLPMQWLTPFLRSL